MAQRLVSWGTKLVSKTTTGTVGKASIGSVYRVASVSLIKAHHIDISSFFLVALTRAAQPHLRTFWGHARVELGPPTPSQWPAVKQGFSK